MADFKSDATGEGAENTDAAKAAGIEEQIRADDQLGNLPGGVEAEVDERMGQSGVDITDEDASTMVDDIEKDAPR